MTIKSYDDIPDNRDECNAFGNLFSEFIHLSEEQGIKYELILISTIATALQCIRDDFSDQAHYLTELALEEAKEKGQIK